MWKSIILKIDLTIQISLNFNWMVLIKLLLNNRDFGINQNPLLDIF